MENLSIDELKVAFDRVALKHIKSGDEHPHPFGQCSIAVLATGDLRHVGISKCSPAEHQFSRKRGRNVALLRAIAESKGHKERMKDKTLRFTFNINAVPAFAEKLVPKHLYLKKTKESEE